MGNVFHLYFKDIIWIPYQWDTSDLRLILTLHSSKYFLEHHCQTQHWLHQWPHHQTVQKIAMLNSLKFIQKMHIWPSFSLTQNLFKRKSFVKTGQLIHSEILHVVRNWSEVALNTGKNFNLPLQSTLIQESCQIQSRDIILILRCDCW